MAATRPPNRFLESLSSADYELLRPNLMSHDLERGQILFDSGADIARIYFPTGAVISLVVTLAGGETVEAGMIGRDGIVGGSGALNGPESLNRAVVQIGGPAVSVARRHLKIATNEAETLRTNLYRHDQFLLAQAQQSAACLAKHDIEARLCRWLLRTRDLAESDSMVLTQQFLGDMLGVRRSSVTLAAKNLARVNLIRYRRGYIEITDLDGVQEAACECYETINLQYRMLLGELRKRADPLTAVHPL